MQQFPPSYRMGPVEIAPATVLAPMAGVTDTVFRRLVRGFGGCGLLMTEFTSSHGVVAGSKRKTSKKPTVTEKYLQFERDEHPISAQLFGSDPAIMADAARVCQDLGFDGVDINLGCPVKKVVTCNGGSGLLRDLPLIESLLKAVRAHIKEDWILLYIKRWLVAPFETEGRVLVSRERGTVVHVVNATAGEERTAVDPNQYGQARRAGVGRPDVEEQAVLAHARWQIRVDARRGG